MVVHLHVITILPATVWRDEKRRAFVIQGAEFSSEVPCVEPACEKREDPERRQYDNS